MCAVDLNGTTQYMSAQVDTEDDYPTPMSVSIWVKPANKGATQGIFTRGRTDSGTFQAFLQILTTGVVRQFCGGNTVGTHSQDSVETVDWDAWNHICAVWNGTSCALYVNGVKVTFTSAVAYNDTTAADWDIVFGALRTTSVSNYLDGKFSQCAVYNDAFVDGDVTTLSTTKPEDASVGTRLSLYKLQTDGNDTDALNNLTAVNGGTFATDDEPPLGGGGGPLVIAGIYCPAINGGFLVLNGGIG